MREKISLIENINIFPDLEREYIIEAMYSVEEKMRIEEEYWQWQENEQRLPARIEIIKHPNYENRRIRFKSERF